MSDTPRPRSTSGDPASVRPGGSGGPGEVTVRHRPAWIVFIVLGAIFCLAMGAWQLARYQSVSGSVQNLGYTFMWPFLAGFLVYAYLRYVRLEAEDRAAKAAAAGGTSTLAAGDDATGAGGSGYGATGDDGEDDDEPDAPTTRPRPARADRRRRGPAVTEIPADFLPTRRAAAATAEPDDEALRAYNDYLAALAEQDRHAEENPDR